MKQETDYENNIKAVDAVVAQLGLSAKIDVDRYGDFELDDHDGLPRAHIIAEEVPGLYLNRLMEAEPLIGLSSGVILAAVTTELIKACLKAGRDETFREIRAAKELLANL